ncbi:MAG: sensor histidine kinase [Lewinellaceae bacterium]|nr:sensor histidine kinase [Lewinellaceae bacterium]
MLDDVHALSDVEEKLLLLARIYNDPAAIPFSPVRLDELIWAAKEQLGKQRKHFKVALDFEKMPENDQFLYVSANEALLRIALLNLMDNGCKYSADHRVQVSARFQPGGVHIVEVRDQGPGIPPEDVQLIFEPFFRSERHRQIKGTGIGLSLVKSILNLHHITLSVESPAQGGTIFRMVFPPLATA